MLPIERAEVVYPDGSTFHIPDDGPWARASCPTCGGAPPVGVEGVVYYHVPDESHLELKTVEAGQEFYVWRGESDGETYKMGLWMDDDGFHRVIDHARRRVEP